MNSICLNLNSIALLLFCCDLVSYKQPPLTLNEWSEVEKAIRAHGLKGPSSLFGYDGNELIEELELPETIAYKMIDRVKSMPIFFRLLDRFESKGIHFTTKYEADFPNILRKKLRRKAPVYLYYCGKMQQFEKSLTITGLSESNSEDSVVVKKLVRKAIDDDFVIICNDSRGTDETVLKYALYHGARVMLVLCNNIEARYDDYKRYVRNGQLVLISSYDPSRHFTIPYGIERNNLAIVLSDYLVIYSAKINFGSAWFGAIQNRHHLWTTALVVNNDYLGNKRLLDLGLIEIKMSDINSLLSYDDIVKNNHQEEAVEVIDVDQMSIFEFIGDSDEK